MEYPETYQREIVSTEKVNVHLNSYTTDSRKADFIGVGEYVKVKGAFEDGVQTEVHIGNSIYRSQGVYTSNIKVGAPDNGLDCVDVTRWERFKKTKCGNFVAPRRNMNTLEGAHQGYAVLGCTYIQDRSFEML